MFDKYNYNLLGFVVSGPILKKRNSDGTKGNSIIGYFLSGSARIVDDTDPSAIGRWKVKDDILNDLQNNPFKIAPNAAAGFLNRSEFLNQDDFENVQAKMNAQEKRLNISGKIDFKPAKNTYLSLGANLYSRTSRDFSYWRSMFSYDDNRESSQNTYRLFGKSHRSLVMMIQMMRAVLLQLKMHFLQFKEITPVTNILLLTQNTKIIYSIMVM